MDINMELEKLDEIFIYLLSLPMSTWHETVMIFVASSTQLSSYGHSAVCSHPLHHQHVRFLELKLEL